MKNKLLIVKMRWSIKIARIAGIEVRILALFETRLLSGTCFCTNPCQPAHSRAFNRHGNFRIRRGLQPA